MCVDLVMKRKELLGLTNQAEPELMDDGTKKAEGTNEPIDGYKEKAVS